MYSCLLWSYDQLQRFNFIERHKIIKQALKNYRKERQLNLKHRLILLLVAVLLPSVLFFIFEYFSLVLLWFVLMTPLVEIKLISSEIDNILPYIDDIISQN